MRWWERRSTSPTRREGRNGAQRLLILEGGHDFAPEHAEALEHLLLRDLLVGVEDEVDEIDAGRLPLLQLTDHLFGIADGDALGRLARFGRAGSGSPSAGQQAGGWIALRGPSLLCHVELS